MAQLKAAAFRRAVAYADNMLPTIYSATSIGSFAIACSNS